MAVADIRRHSGIGWVDLVLFGLFLFGTVLPLGFVGDLPTSRGEPGRLASFVLVGVYVVGLLAVAVAWRSLPTYLRLVRTDRADTGSVATDGDGRVVLRAPVVDAEELLTTPFREVPAVAYMTRVQNYGADDGEPGPGTFDNWTNRWVGEGATSFTVDDDSGPVTVNPADARLYVTGWEGVTVPVDEPLPDHLQSFLDRTTASVRVDPDEEDLRFAEAVLTPGDEAFVHGRTSRGTVDADLVAQGDHATRLRRRVVLGGPLGFVVGTAGYLGLLGHAGLL